jgi:hypothetical protein
MLRRGRWRPTTLAPEGPARPHWRVERQRQAPFKQPDSALVSPTGEQPATGDGPFSPRLQAGAEWPCSCKLERPIALRGLTEFVPTTKLTTYRLDVLGRHWTTLDDASPRTAYSRASWTSLDASGQRAECSTTAGGRCDSCPTCPFSCLKRSGFERIHAEAASACLDALPPAPTDSDKSRRTEDSVSTRR